MSKGVKETNDVLKLSLLIGLNAYKMAKKQQTFEDFINEIKDSDELKSAFKDIQDVPKELLDLKIDDIPEAVKLLASDVVWFINKMKGE